MKKLVLPGLLLIAACRSERWKWTHLPNIIAWNEDTVVNYRIDFRNDHYFLYTTIQGSSRHNVFEISLRYNISASQSELFLPLNKTYSFTLPIHNTRIGQPIYDYLFAGR
jgi:hypothetical protein